MPKGNKNDSSPSQRTTSDKTNSAGKGGKKSRSAFKKPTSKSSRPPSHQHRDQRRDRDDAPPLKLRGPQIDELADLAKKTKEHIAGWLAEGEQLRAQRATTPQNADPTTFPLDPWQKQVLDILQAGESVVVDAPTTAGKTRAVEAFLAHSMHDPVFRAVYTTPVKSLSNDKVRELRALFGEDRVGIATGDIKENLAAPIVVATLESYRNSLLGVEPDLGRSFVIFDEYHYMQDESRGSAWEEAIILTPPHCQILMLSASVANAAEFAEWVASLGKRRCTLVQTTHRPVPLTNLTFVNGQWLLSNEVPKYIQKNLDRNVLDRGIPYDRLVLTLPQAVNLGLTPCIIYAGKRASCEMLAAKIERSSKPLPLEQSTKIGEVLQNLHRDLGVLGFIKPPMRRMIQTYGVAYHHSGLAPAVRIAVERLVKDGLLRFCVATMGLSLGINFSVRSAMIADFERPGESGMTNYWESEILQMLGRAGRRGRDVIGFSLWPSVEYFNQMGQAKREPCQSRLKTDPTTFLGLVGRDLTLAQIEGIYSRSFLKFQNKRVDLRLLRRQDVEQKTGNSSLPCENIASAYTSYLKEDLQSPCFACPVQQVCHSYITSRLPGRLTAMYFHLHAISALDRQDKLTPFGSIARYFPHNGGLLIASMLARREIDAANLGKYAELLAALSLPRFKQPGVAGSYKFPFKPAVLEDELTHLYPIELFPEVYDKGRRGVFEIRDFNVDAAYAVREWISGKAWNELSAEATTPYFGQGDLMGLLYRVASYLQSFAGSPAVGLKKEALALRALILRSPLDLTL